MCNSKKCNLCSEIKDLTEFYGIQPRCKECQKAWRKAYYLQNIDIQKKQMCEYNSKNRELVRNAAVKYNKTEKGLKVKRKYRRKWQYKKYHSDPKFRMAHLLRTRTNELLNTKGLKKQYRFEEYIGCSLDELKSHLESKFVDGMTWENHGEWHVDHIIPLSSANTIEELYPLCHYTNLQPLWGLENIKKGNKI